MLKTWSYEHKGRRKYVKPNHVRQRQQGTGGNPSITIYLQKKKTPSLLYSKLCISVYALKVTCHLLFFLPLSLWISFAQIEGRKCFILFFFLISEKMAPTSLCFIISINLPPNPEVGWLLSSFIRVRFVSLSLTRQHNLLGNTTHKTTLFSIMVTWMTGTCACWHCPASQECTCV